MQYAPRDRKKIAAVLQEQVIPLLQSQSVSQLMAKPPFYCVGVESSVVQKPLLVNRGSNPLNVKLEWEKERLRARRMTLLGFSYSGGSLEKVGITRQMAKTLKQSNLPIPPGITSFRLDSPGVLYVPPHVPHAGQSLAGDGNAHCMLLLWFTDQEFWVTHHDAIQGGTHNLCIADSAFIPLKDAYAQALEKRDFKQGQILISHLMRRLSDYLNEHPVNLSSGAWPTFADKSLLLAPHVSARNARYCYQVLDYIQFHIHAPLTTKILADVCGITVPHLCTIFHKSTGSTVMNYVTDHRLRAAALMLISSTESVGDIARLAGFASAPSFAGAFRRRFGMSAKQYRHENSNLVE